MKCSYCGCEIGDKEPMIDEVFLSFNYWSKGQLKGFKTLKAGGNIYIQFCNISCMIGYITKESSKALHGYLNTKSVKSGVTK